LKPKRYYEMSRGERIEDSDRVAVMELELELRKKSKELQSRLQVFLRSLEKKEWIKV